MQRVLVETIRAHPDIHAAAITGSRARANCADSFSDLDILLVATDLASVRNIRSWFPPQLPILICAFHLTDYCSILLDSFQKIDLAILSVDDASCRWIVHDYQVVKGGPEFESQLAGAAADTRGNRAAHRNPDVSIDNVLLLLATAVRRQGRGEALSAHAFLEMAGHMLISVEKQSGEAGSEADSLDPWRRLERTHPDLADVLHAALFTTPDCGCRVLTQYLAERYRTWLSTEQQQVADHLLRQMEL
jgi:hypothetical protein